MNALSGVRTIIELQAEADTLGLTAGAANAYIDAEHTADLHRLEIDPIDIRPGETFPQWRGRVNPPAPRRRWWERAA
jgi:hypothetical protein